MSDHRFVLDALDIIRESLELVAERMADITAAADFVRSEKGRILADAILLRLQVMSRKIERIRELRPGLLEQYGIDHERTTPTNYLLALHYDEIDYELLFDFCTNELPLLRTAFQNLRASWTA